MLDFYEVRRMEVKIYRPSKSAMQSGRAGKAGWVLSFVPSEAQRADQLVGWYGSADTAKQVSLHQVMCSWRSLHR